MALKKPIEVIVRDSIPFFFFISMLVLIFVWWKAGSKLSKKYAIKCNAERELAFEGKISNYTSNVMEERGVFNLNDTSQFYTIPRSSKAMYLIEGDTIIKLKNSNRYFVIRHEFGTNSLIKKAVDTFDFDCPDK